jgi:hypothetical protein
MSSRHFLFIIGSPALPLMTGAELNRSIDPVAVCATIDDQDRKPIEITPDQWRFLRGVYAMNVEAPPGLPYGDDAVLAQGVGDSDGQLFFIDGDKSCAPMQAPPALLSLMERVTMADDGSVL